jgi:peptidoglycan/LPS O-acetylase OafA/YrhL
LSETLLNTKPAKRHFHTFDALRFFACLKVFLHHLPILAFPWFVVIKTGGGIGVQFFFVLSGFLITYIILEEREQTGQLNLKHFFVRRVLRIWPLFYLAIAIAFFTPLLLAMLHLGSSQVGYEPDWLWSVLFLENYKMMITHANPNVSPLGVMWSLCIEEHFYILWGILLYIIPIKKVMRLIILCIVLSPICRYIYIANGIPTLDIFTNIDLFAYGAIPAYLLITKKQELENTVNGISILWKRMFVVMLLAAIVVFAQPHAEKWDVITTSITGLLFSVLVLFTLPASSRFKIGDKNVLSKWGTYTYGFYIYHTLVINLLLRLFEKGGFRIDAGQGAVLFIVAAFTLSLGISMLSYHLFEKQFLKLKKLFR